MASADIDDVCENAPDAGFTDAGTTHADNIDCLAAYGITTGQTATTFGTFAPLSRGQAATLFVNFAVVATDGAIADDIDATIDVPFVDIAGTTHEGNIEALYRLGLIEGTSATTYEPGANISRAQFATILFNAHVALGVDFADTYPDAFGDDDGSVHEDAINALAGEGIISGTSATTYSPSADVTRGQTATLLMESAGVLDTLGLWAAARLPEQPDDGDPALAGFTDAPELIQVTTFPTPGIAEYIFDERGGPVTGVALSTIDLIDEGLATDEASCLALGANNFEEGTGGDPDTCFLYEDFLIYAADGTPSWPYEARIINDRVRVRYYVPDGTSATDPLQSATRATVRYNGVENTARVPNIEGDYPLSVTETATPGSPYAPVLEEVGNRRLAPITIGGEQLVLVDFTFDSPVGTVFNDQEGTSSFGPFTDQPLNAGEFYAVGNASAEYQGITFFRNDLGAIALPDPDEETVTVVMAAEPTELPGSQVARGYVVGGVNGGDTGSGEAGVTYTSTEEPEVKLLVDGNETVAADPGDYLITSAPYVDNAGDGTSVDPDLVGAERSTSNANRVEFTFDEAISDEPAEFDAMLFGVFNGDGEAIYGQAAFPTADPVLEARTMFVDFAPGALDGANGPYYGAFVADGAVRATDSLATANAGFNRPAYAPLAVAPEEVEDDVTTGTTAKPDLEEVRVALNTVTNNYQVAFEFDQALTGDIDEINFDLFDDEGTLFRVEGAVAGRSLQASNTTVVFSVDAGFSVLTNEQIAASVVGAVQISDQATQADTAVAILDGDNPTEGRREAVRP